MLTFCPLQGALTESSASQSLLELDGGVKVLVDLGWDGNFDIEQLKELERQIPTLSLILLTHAKASHLAAYAHCCKNFPLFTRIPVYATRPIIDLGRTLTQDLYASSPAAATTIPQESLSETAYSFSQPAATQAQNLLLQSPSNEEIARYFSSIQPLKYSQPHQPLPSPFSPPLNGLTITAYNAGHTLGGTIWHIQHGLESIVYAVDWNQARENVFAGAAWLGGAGGGGAEVIEALKKPTALICSSRGGNKTSQAGGRAKRDEHLLEMIRSCVTKGGTVLIPVDSSARVLEMSYLLEHAWRTDAQTDDGKLKSAKLYLAGRNMSSTMRYARSMLEWMDDSIVQEFEAFAEVQRKVNGAGEGKGAGPFDFKYLRLLERKAQIAKLLEQGVENGSTEGRVILASDTSMDWGFSRDILKGLAKDSRNLVILTDRPALAREDAPSIARTLWSLYNERNEGVATEKASSGDSIELVYGGGQAFDIQEAQREALVGDELTLYQQWLATQRQLQATQQTGGAGALEGTVDIADDASESSSDSEDEDGEQQGKALNVSATLNQASRKNVVLKDEDLGINVLIKKKGVYDFDTRGKKGREKSFPLTIRRKRADDFGEMIHPADFLRAEEKEEDNVDGGPTATDDDKLGKKRKWDGVAAASSNKRAQPGKPGVADDEGHGANDGFVADELDTVEDDEPEETGVPSKLVYTTETVVANLKIAYVDFSGLHDKRSLNMLIPLIQPRKLILVGGNHDETRALADDCRSLLGGAGDRAVEVLTPQVGAWVDASVDTNAWVVKLADPLVKKLKWQNVKGLGIVTISGQLLAQGLDSSPPKEEQPPEEAPSKRQKTDLSAAVALTNNSLPASTPTLDMLPMHLASVARTAAQPLHVGDLRLADLRRAMQSASHTAEFRGEGTLVIDGCVAVRKTSEGRIEVESVGLPMGGRRSALYEVKRVIYDNLAVVGA